MTRLKLDVRRWDNVVAIQVMEQDDNLRGKGSLIRTSLFQILSHDSIEIGNNKLFVRGKVIYMDDKVVSHTFGDIFSAKRYMDRLASAVSELNHGKSGGDADSFGCSREVLG